MPGGEVGWFGLQDFLKGEGTFTWADGSPLGDYTNWARNQPDNNGKGQVSRNQRGIVSDGVCEVELQTKVHTKVRIMEKATTRLGLSPG